MANYQGLFNSNNFTGDFVDVSTIISDSLQLTATTNQLILNNTTITDVETTPRTITIPATAGANGSFVLTNDVGQVIGGDNTFTGYNSFSNLSGIAVNNINEYSSGSGVTVAGTLIKDGVFNGASLNFAVNISGPDNIYPILYSDAVTTGQVYSNSNFTFDSSNGTITATQFQTNIIVEAGLGAGTSVNNVLLKNGVIADSNYGLGLLHANSSGVVTSSLIVNSDISGGIAYDKLNLSGSVTASNINSNGTTSGFVLCANGTDSGTWISPFFAGGDLQTAYLNTSGGAGAHIRQTYGIGGIVINNDTTLADAGRAALIIAGSGPNEIRLNFDATITSTAFVSGGVLKGSAVYGVVSCSKLLNTDVNSASATTGQALTADGSGNASWLSPSAVNINITNTSGTGVYYPTFVDGISGNLIMRTHDPMLKYYPASNILQCNNFLGVASKSIDTYIIDTTTTDASYNVLFCSSTNDYLGARSDSTNLTYNPFTNTLNCANILGNASTATLATTATTATTATAATTVTLANDTANATDYLCFSNTATGNRAIKTTTGITCNPSTATITATTFAGALTGNATTATAATTVTLANDTANATDYLCFSNTATGDRAIKTNTGINCNPATANITASSFSGQLIGTISATSTATTQTALDNSTKIATTAYVDAIISAYNATLNYFYSSTTTAQAIANNTITRVQWNSANTVTNGTGFTIQQTGSTWNVRNTSGAAMNCLVSYNFTFPNTASSTKSMFGLVFVGATANMTGTNYLRTCTALTSGNNAVCGSGIVPVPSNHYIEFALWHDFGSSLNTATTFPMNLSVKEVR